MKGIVLISLLAAVLLLAGCASPSDTNANNQAPAPQNIPAANPNPQTAPPTNPNVQPANPNLQTGPSTNPTAQPSPVPPQNPGAGITNGQPEAPPTQANQPEAVAAGCTSPYDGTWKGTIADSGELRVSRPPDYITTYNPFTASYDFEMTIQCAEEYTDQNGIELTDFNITHVKASHPFFDCVDGCAPSGSYFTMKNDGAGYMWIDFPNGALIDAFDGGNGEHYTMQIASDGKTMALAFENPSSWEGSSIGSIWDKAGHVHFVETFNCEQIGAEGCAINYLLSNTMTLTKVS